MIARMQNNHHTRHKMLPGKYDANENMQKISDLLCFNPFHCF